MYQLSTNSRSSWGCSSRAASMVFRRRGMGFSVQELCVNDPIWLTTCSHPVQQDIAAFPANQGQQPKPLVIRDFECESESLPTRSTRAGDQRVLAIADGLVRAGDDAAL